MASDDHSPRQRTVELRFYEELNDLLAPDRRRRTFVHAFTGTPTIKDVVESLGVPHTEVDLILVDGVSVGFDHHLHGGERVAVYPMFERLDIAPLTRLRPAPLREPRFVCDVHLGKLARHLRMLGLDAAYDEQAEDPAIVAQALREKRIILTRDKGILKHGDVTHGHWVRSVEPRQQVVEVLRALDLRGRLDPFTRCLECNGVLRPVDRDEVAASLPPTVLERQTRFARCPQCRRVYWAGSHYDRMRACIDDLLAREDPS
jgi:uncharacterized protein with PIN domain